MKRAIFTGGTGGLGKIAVEKFRLEGWEVLGLGSRDLDLSDTAAVEEFFSVQDCDLLVCGAGMIRDQTLLGMGEEDWDQVLEVNYSAAAVCAVAAIRKMVERGGGHVIFISSHAAIHPAVGQASYAAAKAALLGLTVDLAARFGGENIRVNTVLPGFLETPMTREVSAKRKETVRDSHHLGKFNTPEVVADFLWFLHEKMPFTSGQVFQLDSRPGFF